MTTEEYLAFLGNQESPGGDIFSLAGRPRAPVPPPVEAKRKVMLPNGDYVSVGPEVSDEEALSRARAKYPGIFNQAASSEEDSGPIDAFVSTLDRTVTGFVPGVRAAFAAATGDEETYDEQQQKIIEARESATARAPGLRRVGDIGEAYDKDGFLSAAAVGTEFGVEQIGSSLGGQAPVMAAGLAGATLGGLIGGPVGGVVGFWAGRTLAGIGRYMSEDLERGYAEGLADTKDVDLGKTLVAATGQSLLDNLGFFVLGGAAKIGREPVAGVARSAVGKLYDKIGGASPLNRFLGTMVEEEVAELGQQALERWQAGLEVSPENEEAAAEYTEILLATLFPSIGFAGMTEVGSKIAAKRALLTDAETEEHYKDYVKIQEALRKSEERLAAEEIEAEAERRDVGEDFRDRRGSFWLGRMQELAGGLRSQYERIIFNNEKVTVKDVTQIADDRNIIWDNDPAFMAFSKRVGKNLHLDSMNDEQLLLMYKRISAMPRQESKSHLAYASAEEATELGAKLNKGKGNVTLAGVRSKLGLNGAGINDDVADSIANGHIEKMVDMGLVEVSTTSSGKNKYKLIGSRLPMGVSEADYKKIIQESTDSKDGRFPSFQEAVKKYGIESKRAYKKLRAAAVARRDIETRGDKDYISEDTRDLKSYQLLVNGNVEATRYSSLEEAQEARASIYSQGTAEEGAAKVSVTAARPMGVVKIVETPARAIPEAAEGHQYSVSHKDGSRGKVAWIVRKRAEEGSTKGDFVKSFPSKRKADEYVANADSNTMAFDVMVDGVRKGRAGNRRDAGILKEDLKRSAYATRYASIVDSLSKTTNHGSQTLHRLAKQQATSYANAYGKSLKIESVGVESGLAAPSKEVGFSLSEAVTEGSKRSRMKEIDFFDYTEGLAKLDALRESGQVTPSIYEKTKERLIKKAENSATGERDLIVGDRTGRESLKGRLRKGERPEAADVQAAEAIPVPTMADLSSQAKAIPAPEQTTQQQELVQASSRKIGSVLRSLGLGDVRVNITEALEDTTGGHANFDPVAQVINIAYTSGLKSIEAEADLTKALLPLVRHETVHIFRKLGVIKPTEWKSLTGFVSKRKIPEARLESLNASLIEAGNSPLAAGATYLDYAHSANAQSGSRASQLDELSARLEAGEISREEHAALVEKENSLKFIEDDYIEEAVAQAFQDVASGDLALAGAPRTMVKKISGFVGGVYRSFTGQGYRSADEVFTSLYGGNFKSRVENSRTLDPWYARRAGETVELKEDLTRAREDLLVSMSKRREVLRSRGKTEEEITDLLGEEFQGVSASGVEAGLETAARRRASRVDSEDGPDRKRHSSAGARGYEYPDSPAHQRDLRISKEAMKEREYYDEIPDGAPIEEHTKKANFHEIDRVRRWALGVFKSNFEAAIDDRSEEWEGWEQAYWSADTNASDTLREGYAEEEFPGVGPENIAAGIAEANSDHGARMAIFRTELQAYTSRYGGKDPELQAWTEDYFNELAEQYPYEFGDPKFLHHVGEESFRDFDKHPVGSSAPTPRPDRKRHSSAGAGVVSEGDAHRAAETQRGEPEMVMDEITGRAGSVFPAALKDLLMIVGDISHRAQRGGGVAIRNVREKVDSVLAYGTYKASIPDELELAGRFNAERKVFFGDPEFRRRVEGLRDKSPLYDEYREKYAREVEREIESQRESEVGPLSRYVDAHENHNVALTEMGKLGKDMAIHLGKGEYDALMEKARVLDGLVSEYENLENQGRRDEAEALRLRAASPDPRPDRRRHSSTPALRDGSEELKASTPAVDPYTVGEIENQPFNAAVPPASFEVIPPPAISQSETVASTVGETSWFGIPYNRTGAKSKSGMPVVVLEGYHEEESTAQDGTRIPERGFGAAHLDRHNRDIADFTPYTTWSELLTDFGRELRLFNDLESSPTTARRGNIIPYPDQGATSYIWDDPSFTKPVLVRTMDIQRKDIDGVDADVAYIVSAYPTDNFSATVGGRRNITGHLHGENASLDSVKTYLDPESSPRLSPPDRRRHSTNGYDGRTRSQINALEDAGLPQGKGDGLRTLWDSFKEALASPDRVWLERLNQSFLDRYSRIDTFAKRARAKAEEMGYESVLDLFDTSAHAMALMSDKAGGYLATSLRDGILTYRHGVPMVEEQGLVTSAPRREFDVETGETVEREVVSVPGMYAEGATGGIFPILDALSTPGRNLLPELFLYMRALRGARLNHEGRETQLSGKTIEAGYQAARDNPEIVIAAQNIQNWNDGIVQFQIDTGVISKELGDVYRKYSDYIPFYIDLEGVRTEAIEGIILKELGRPDSEMFLAGGIANQRAHMKFSGLGKDQVISDPIESIVRNAKAAITAGLKNVASQRAIRDALDIDQATEISSRQLANQGVAGKKNAVTIRIEGQDRHFVLKDPLFFEAMTGAFGGRNPYFEFLGMPARVLRGLVTRSPDYLVANMLRDSLHVYILNGGEATPIIDAAKTMASNVSKMTKGEANPTYTTLQRLGAISGIEHAELTPARMTRQFARDSGTGSRVKNAFQSFWDQTGELSSRSESATRENVYESAYAHAIKKYKGMGFDRLDANGVNIAERKAMGEAAYQAVEVLNFSRHGSNPYMQFVAATVPFLNSRIQGLATMVRSIKGDSPTGRLNPQDAKISHLNRALAVSSVTVMYTILSEMDDDRDDLPDVVKEDYWLVPVPGIDYYLGMPTPFEAGVMYKALPEMITRGLIGLMTDGMHGSTFKEFKDSLGHAIFSTLNLNPMPQAFKPAYEWMANKNSYTTNPIVPEWQKKMPGADQYGDGTTAQAMLLSRGVESVFGSRSSVVPSPRNIDNAMRTLFGGVGVYAIQALDNTLRWAVPGMPTRPAPQLSDIPVLKRFLRSKYGGGLKNDFYEIKNSIDGLVLAVKQSAESGEPERATRLAMENENLLAVRSAIGRIEKKLSAIRNGRSMDFRNNALTREREIMYDEAEGRALALVPELKRTLGNW